MLFSSCRKSTKPRRTMKGTVFVEKNCDVQRMRGRGLPSVDGSREPNDNGPEMRGGWKEGQIGEEEGQIGKDSAPPASDHAEHEKRKRALPAESTSPLICPVGHGRWASLARRLCSPSESCAGGAVAAVHRRWRWHAAVASSPWPYACHQLHTDKRSELKG